MSTSRRPPLVAAVLAAVLAVAALVPGPASAGDAARPTADRSSAQRAPSPWLVDPSARGAAGRVPDESFSNPDFNDVPAACYTPEETLSTAPCRLVPRRPGAPLIVLWGDSHAWQMSPALRRAVRGKKVNVISFMQGACPVMDSDLSTPQAYADRNSCDEFGHEVLDFLDKARRWKRPLRVVVSMSWELYHNVTDPPDAADERYPGYVNDYIRLNARKGLQGTPRAFQALARMRITTDVVAQQPMVYQTAPTCSAGGFRCPLPRFGVLKDAKENNLRVRQLRDLLSVKGVVIRPSGQLCTRSTCTGEYQGVPTYYDRIHLGQRTSYRLAPLFAPTVQGVLRAARTR